MEKLSRYAGKGWILENFALFGFKLRKGNPQKLTYSLDYQTNPDEEYFAFFQESGWSHVCSAGNEMHIFSAPPGTKPIYSDQATLVEKYAHEQRRTGKFSVFSLILTLFFFTLTFLAKYQVLPDVMSYIRYPLAILSMVLLTFSGLPYLAYRRKVKKLASISSPEYNSKTNQWQ